MAKHVGAKEVRNNFSKDEFNYGPVRHTPRLGRGV